METWIYIAAFLVVFAFFSMLFSAKLPKADTVAEFIGRTLMRNLRGLRKRKVTLPGACLAAAVLVVVIMVLLQLFSSPVFNAKRYANIAGSRIAERDFIEDTPVSETIDEIALMDTESAQIIGSRALGSLNDLVSQFESILCTRRLTWAEGL